MITHNRPGFTERALSQLLDTCDDSMRVWVWHNGTHQETLDVVRKHRAHPAFHHLEHSVENKRLAEPTNWFWKNSNAQYLTKVDDDCLLPLGWAQSLIKAHEAHSELGSICCWRFYDEDTLPEALEKKTVTLKTNQQLVRNSWVQGSGYVMKRELVEQCGPLRESYPAYCIRAARSGWQNGWLYPFIHEEHMDDPRSEFYPYKNDQDFLEHRPLTAIQDGVESLAEYKRHTKYMAKLVQIAHPDPKFHSGWRKKLSNLKLRLKKQFNAKPWE